MLTPEYYVYALKSLKNGSLYIGLSKDPQKRVIEHNQGMTHSTKSRRPFELFFSEKCADRQSARIREKYYKSGVGREFLKAIIK